MKIPKSPILRYHSDEESFLQKAYYKLEKKGGVAPWSLCRDGLRDYFQIPDSAIKVQLLFYPVPTTDCATARVVAVSTSAGVAPVTLVHNSVCDAIVRPFTLVQEKQIHRLRSKGTVFPSRQFWIGLDYWS